MLTLLASLALLAAAPEFEISGASGSTFGRLVDASAETMTFATADGSVSFKSDEILGIDRRDSKPARPGDAGIRIELIDGSTLVARKFRAAQGNATVVTHDERSLAIPGKSIARVRFAEQSGTIADQWAEIAAIDHAGDCIVLRKQNALDYLTGVLGDVTDDVVNFETDGEKFEVKRTRVEGLLYARTKRAALPEAACTVIDASGSKLEASKLSFAEGVLHVTTPAGFEAAVPLEQLDRIAYKVQFLSDLKPDSVAHVPYLAAASTAKKPESRFHRPRFNASASSGPLRVTGANYAKGISLYSRTELVYRLPEGISRLQAIAGLDPTDSAHGNVRLVISGDDRVLLERTIQGSEVVPISVPLGGVRRLKVVVDFNGDEVADRLNLCEARLLK
jgi:hypothetical protein